jgi:hypothetical protein
VGILRHGGPLLVWLLGGCPTPTTRQVSGGDRHLNFYGNRDNLGRRRRAGLETEEVGFEPASTLVGRPRSGAGRCCDLRLRRTLVTARADLPWASTCLVGRAPKERRRAYGESPLRLPHPSEVMRSRTAAPTCLGGTVVHCGRPVRTWHGSDRGCPLRTLTLAPWAIRTAGTARMPVRKKDWASVEPVRECVRSLGRSLRRRRRLG